MRDQMLKKQNIDFLYNIKMSGKTLKFGNVNKKEFQVSKQAIALNLVDIDQMVLFDKFKQYEKGFNILLVTDIIISLDFYVLLYLKWVDI